MKTLKGMKVPVTPDEHSDGLYLKYFVLKLDGSDPAALEALEYYAERRVAWEGGNAERLLKDVRKLHKELRLRGRMS